MATGKRFDREGSGGLITLFNHQTHHRGQIHCLLTQSDIAPPPLDVLDYLMGE